VVFPGGTKWLEEAKPKTNKGSVRPGCQAENPAGFNLAGEIA